MQRLSADDPRRIGEYRLLGRLGEGGMGRVYLARSGRGRTVAVKVVKAELARQADFRRRFAQEISAARRVGGEWTAPVLGADTEADTPWVATGYIAGPSLSEIVDDQYGPLPEYSVAGLATGLVRALSDIHGAGLVHRDLKPSNVLVTIDGPRVIDFGIARALDSAVQSGGALTRTGALVGSPGFMSPEQVRGQRVTPASDVFCLGTVLAFAATGHQPFGTADSGIHALLFRIAEEEPELSGLSGPLYDLVRACLEKDPAHRPTLETLSASTVGEFHSAWLPGQVLAELGRHAVQLLDSEDPDNPDPSDSEEDRERTASGDEAAEHAAAGVGAGPAPSASPSTPPPPSSPPSTPPPSGYGPPPAYSGQVGQPAGAGWQSTPPGAYSAGSPYAGAPASAVPPPGTGPAAGLPQGAARSARTLSRFVAVLMVLLLLWTVGRIIVGFAAASALSNAPGYLSDSSVSLIDGFTGLKNSSIAMDLIGGPLGVSVMVLWAVWMYRVRVNAEAFAPGGIRYTRGLAAGSWFIPICHLFIPKQILNDIWEKTAGAPAAQWWYGPPPPGVRTAGGRGLLNCWWMAWLVYLVGRLVTFSLYWYSAESLSSARIQVLLVLATDFFGIFAGWLALALMFRLTSLQEARISGRQ